MFQQFALTFKNMTHRCSSYSFNLLYVILISALITSCGKNAGNKKAEVPLPNEEYFQEIAGSIGLDFVHSIGGHDLNNIIESSCGGTAFLDYDQDGYIDIYVTSGTWLQGGFTKG